MRGRNEEWKSIVEVAAAIISSKCYHCTSAMLIIIKRFGVLFLLVQTREGHLVLWDTSGIYLTTMTIPTTTSSQTKKINNPLKPHHLDLEGKKTRVEGN